MQYKLIDAEMMDRGSAKVYAVGGKRILVAYSELGEYFAVEDRCSHDDAAFGDGEIFGYEVECPRHGACFDVRNGKALTLPATEDIESYPVAIAADGIYVEIDE